MSTSTFASTFVTTVQNPTPCNKHVYFNDDGDIKKHPAQRISEATARTIPVADPSALEAVLEAIGRDPTATLILGFVPGTDDGEPYRLLSKRLMAERLGVEEPALPGGLQTINGERWATRTKDTFAPSSWMLFDYDKTEGMPETLRTGDQMEWWSWMCQLIPGLASCGALLTASTSSRVMKNDAPAFQNGGWHAFVQVQEASDIERFGQDLLIHALSTDFGFLRPLFDRETGEVRGQRPWAIFDPSTFSRERLVYDGAPTVSGESLHVTEPSLRVIQGGRLDTTALSVTPTTRRAVAARTGLRVERNGIGGAGDTLINDSLLRLDTEIETKVGAMTVETFGRSEHKKLRAQAVFRPESVSWAAFLGRHQDGSPFLYDIGQKTKYTLSEDQTQAFQVQCTLDWIEDSPAETVKAGWTDRARGLGRAETRSVLDAVQRKTEIPLQPLKASLRDAKEDWKHEQTEAQAEAHKQDLLEEGRLLIPWLPDKLPEIVQQVGQRLVDHPDPGEVYQHSGRLVTVKPGVPRTVRQIQRSVLGAPEAYPSQPLIQAFTDSTCRQRVLSSVAFSKPKNNSLIDCPTNVVRVLMDDPNFAPPLSGLQEAPVMKPQGSALREVGYDAQTGLYGSFDPALMRDLPEHASREDAERALDYLRTVFFGDFPFKKELDFAAAVALLLTAFLRRFLAKAPGFLVSATTQASGKSALVELVFRAAYGRPASASSWSDDQAEMAKHLLAILSEGQSGVCFDNLPFGHRVDGDELAKVITQEQFSGRVLGENTTRSLPTNLLICVTGNQLRPINDMATRLLPILLEPECENPENRQFSRPDIERWSDENRAEVVQAVYTLLLAWHQRSDEAGGALATTRFAEWDHAVRAPMLWLGLPDVKDKFQENRAENEAAIANANIVDLLYGRFGGNWFTAKEALGDFGVGSMAIRRGTLTGFLSQAEWMTELRDQFLDVPDHEVSAKRLGRRLAKMQGAIFDGLKLDYVSQGKRGFKYRVIELESQRVVAEPPEESLPSWFTHDLATEVLEAQKESAETVKH